MQALQWEKTITRGLIGLLSVVAISAQAVATELPFYTVKASYQGSFDERQFDAVIEAVKKATISAETAGRVVEMRFDVNGRVKRGDILLRFKGIEQRAETGMAQAGLRDAQARLAEAKANYDRTQELYERKLVARAALDNATAARISAQEQVESARARLQQAEAQMGYTEIRAPFSGAITQRHIEVGEAAMPGQPLISLVSLDGLRATTTIPQMSIEAVRHHQQVRLLVPGQPTRPIVPSNITIFPVAESGGHGVKVRLDLPATQQGVIPGMMVKAVFVTGSDQRMLLPEAAIARRSEMVGVYVVAKDRRLMLRQIRAGKRYDNGRTEVLAGLDDGEIVAADAVKAAIFVKQQRSGAK